MLGRFGIFPAGMASIHASGMSKRSLTRLVLLSFTVFKDIVTWFYIQLFFKIVVLYTVFLLFIFLI